MLRVGASSILKKAGKIYVNDLWAILLMEVDFNVAMKILLGHRMVCNAIKSHAVPQECFGSLLEHRAIQVPLNRCLIADVMCQQCSTLALTSVDCNTCYNSIGHAPASIACQRLGAPQLLLGTVFQMIQLMKFFLQMAYGNSDRYYGGGSSMLPFQGVCQGNRVGPAIWLVTSIILMNMVKTNGYQVSIFSPITKQLTNLIGLLYVDDCDLFAVNMDRTHPRWAIAQPQ